MMDFAAPAWLDARAIADARLGEAYESLTEPARSTLKTCIARLHVVWGERAEEEARAHVFRQGFSVREEETAAPFVLVLCDAGYVWPACLLAAVMPAVLAGVPLILPCFAPQGPLEEVERAVIDDHAAIPQGMRALPSEGASGAASPLLAAMELAGVERCYALGEEAALELLVELHAAFGRGRLILMGGSLWGEPLILKAAHLGIPCQSFLAPPVFARLDENASESRIPPALSLDADHEGVWVWPELGPSWFRNRRMQLRHS